MKGLRPSHTGPRGGREGTDAPIVTVTDASFDEVVRGAEAVVVDCWAPWCGPCRMLAPLVEELASAYAGKVVFGKLNTDENPQIAERFGIMSIPTLLFFKNGKLVDSVVGVAPRAYLEQKIKRLLWSAVT